jgi:hypothetical protein
MSRQPLASQLKGSEKLKLTISLVGASDGAGT